MLQLKNVTRRYLTGESRVTAVNNLSFQIKKNEFVAITGPSGSGKSTLLGLLAGLDRPDEGSIEIDGTDIATLTENELARWRGARLGYVFQNFQLITSLSALENVALPAEIAREPDAERRAAALLNEVGLGSRLGHFPGQLSGGEQQRVAIARALIRNPSIILADEPTGNLDSKTGKQILDLLVAAGKTSTLVLVTHDPSVAKLADREIQLADGALAAEKGKRSQTKASSEKSASKPKRKAAAKATAKAIGKKKGK